MEEFIQNVLREIVNPIITVIALLAFAFFVWGVVEFIQNADNDEKRKIGQQHMIWGIVGLVILFAAQALLAIIGNTANFLFRP